MTAQWEVEARTSEMPALDAIGGTAMAAGIDRYLLHSFAASAADRSLGESGTLELTEALKLPMLVRVVDESAITELEEMPDCEITSAIGNIIACRGSTRTLAALQGNSKVISVEGGRPSSGLDCKVSVSFVRADQVHSDPNLPEKGDGALIAVIDDGIDVLHESFRDASGNTRIATIWDQTDSTGPHWNIPGRTPYGTVHTSTDINRYIQKGKIEKGLTRNSAALGSLGELVGGHGTHVTSIAAGRAAGKFHGGIAPKATIVIVIPKLDVSPPNPRSLGYSNSHVDALSYIAAEADRLKLPVVVNVSQGQNAGAHDGTSNLETAFDNFSDGGRRGGRVIVKSGGNERGHDGHAKFEMSKNDTKTLDWESKQAHDGPDVVELWFRACDELKFRLIDPNDDATAWVGPNDSVKDQFPTSGYRYQIGYDRFHWDNGDSRVLVTIEPGSQFQIGKGVWHLEIESGTVSSDGTVHAWLERDNHRPILFTNHRSEEFTLSIPGTARTVIAVGAVRSKMPAKLATYSSYGPTRDARDKPDLVAPGEAIIAAWGGTANDAGPMSGTSMAAPHVTGAIALLLSARAKQIKSIANAAQFNAAQIRAAITQSSQNFNGRSTNALGYGVLDVRAFLGSFGL
jgi:endonuclease G